MLNSCSLQWKKLWVLTTRLPEYSLVTWLELLVTSISVHHLMLSHTHTHTHIYMDDIYMTFTPIHIYLYWLIPLYQASQVALVVKNPPANTGDIRGVYLSSGSGRSLGGHGNPLQYSCLENQHGQGSLVCCSSWSRKELDTTERLNWTETRKG